MFVSCVPSGLFTREFARLVGWTSSTEGKYKYTYKLDQLDGELSGGSGLLAHHHAWAQIQTLAQVQIQIHMHSKHTQTCIRNRRRTQRAPRRSIPPPSRTVQLAYVYLVCVCVRMNACLCSCTIVTLYNCPSSITSTCVRTYISHACACVCMRACVRVQLCLWKKNGCTLCTAQHIPTHYKRPLS